VEEIKAEILKVNKARSQSVKDKDAGAFLATLAEDWGYSNERGQTFPREQWADDFMTTNFHTPFAEHVDVEWHVFGENTVVETGRSNSTLVYKGKVSHGPRRETAVYAKVNGKWVLLLCTWVSSRLNKRTLRSHQVRFRSEAGGHPPPQRGVDPKLSQDLRRL
jgi:hypothetical protein